MDLYTRVTEQSNDARVQLWKWREEIIDAYFNFTKESNLGGRRSKDAMKAYESTYVKAKETMKASGEYPLDKVDADVAEALWTCTFQDLMTKFYYPEDREDPLEFIHDRDWGNMVQLLKDHPIHCHHWLNNRTDGSPEEIELDKYLRDNGVHGDTIWLWWECHECLCGRCGCAVEY